MIFRSLSPITHHPSPKRAGIFDPYLDTMGGGERYCLTLAEALLRKGWEVDFFWNDDSLKAKLQEKFGLEIDRVNYLSYSPRKNNLLKRRDIESNYDLLFYVSDGSIPFMFGKRNFLHFQVPFKKVLNRSLKNSIKLKTIDAIICNSMFTKKVVDENLGVNSVVIYPPVDIKPIKPLKKEKIILSVGRFSQLLQNKRQDVLVKAFKKMIEDNLLHSWKLILAGGSEIGGKEFVETLKKISAGYPIEIMENIPFEKLIDLYGHASIFWSASGYGIDENIEPEKVEHFGISTVEAMAAGCIPIVLGKGGQKEIVEEGETGFLWQNEEELINSTKRLINNTDLVKTMSQSAIKRSKVFEKESFYRKVSQFLDEG